MSKELTTVPEKARALGITLESEWETLRRILYPDASEAAVLLVLGYCKAKGLDPLKKLVHIVTTWNAEKRREEEGIWPGIGLHRTVASRTTEYAGIDMPVFGPMQTSNSGFKFPEWASVTVYRIVKGQKCAFTSLVHWMESVSMYKDKQTGKMVPNAMWRKRPHDQLAKCAEAAALRMAFPEELGAEATFEEMHGRGSAVTVDAEETVIDQTDNTAALIAQARAESSVGPAALLEFMESLPADSREKLRTHEAELMRDAEKAEARKVPAPLLEFDSDAAKE